MIHAYDESYLDDAMECLGEAMDYCANCCNVGMDDFLGFFISTGYSERFAAGAPSLLAGTSGTELVMEVLSEVGFDQEFPKVQIEYGRSPQYWCGWILAFYQWYTGLSFKEICSHTTMKDIERLYPALHEASEERFVDAINRRVRRKLPPTRLQSQRRICGYTQKELSQKAGVNLRTLQQYEIRAKDINKAAGSMLCSLSKTLGCRIEDLLEYSYAEVEDEGVAETAPSYGR